MPLTSIYSHYPCGKRHEKLRAMKREEWPEYEYASSLRKMRNVSLILNYLDYLSYLVTPQVALRFKRSLSHSCSWGAPWPCLGITIHM